MEDVYSSIQNDLSESPLAIHYLCNRFITNVSYQDPEFPRHLSKCIEAYESHIQSHPSLELAQYYSEFLLELKNKIQQENLNLYLKLVLQKLYSFASCNSLLTPDMIIQWFLLTNDSEILQKGLEMYPKSCLIWKNVILNHNHSLEMYSKALQTLTGPESFPIWMDYLTILEKNQDSQFVVLEFEVRLFYIQECFNKYWIRNYSCLVG